MKSVTTEKFRLLFASAPPERRIRIKDAYRLWQENPAHPSLRFKKVHSQRLVASMDTDAEIEAAWEREADRREAELESGAVAAIPGDEVFTRLRAKLAR